MITLEKKQELVAKFGDNPKDTGKTEVQIAILSADIEALTQHLKSNKKDHHSKRGLFQKVGKRKKLLKYLHGNDINRYRTVLEALGLRK